MKRIPVTAVVAVVAVLAASSGATRAWASNFSGWLSPVALQVVKDEDVAAFPNGRAECIFSGSTCFVSTKYGASSGDRVQLSGFPTSVPISPFTLPVPDSNVLLWIGGSPINGQDYVFLRHDFLSSVTPRLNTDLSLGSLQITQSPETRSPMQARDDTIVFSQNGQWMIFDSPGLGIVRVNLKTFEFFTFGLPTNYDIGLDPALRFAISDDGRFVAEHQGFGGAGLTIYDLNSCVVPAPGQIVGTSPVTGYQCQSRNIQPELQSALPGYYWATPREFIGDDTLVLYTAQRLVDGTIERSRVLVGAGVSPAGINYLALGDSYSSGEGAFNYRDGTDVAGTNLCHQSLKSYPYLAGVGGGIGSVASVACSGARMRDITSTSQYGGDADAALDSFFPGIRPQLDFVRTYRPQRVTVGIGGNDIGFREILTSCAGTHTCYDTASERSALVNTMRAQFTKLVNTFKAIKFTNAGPDGRAVYVVAYPQVVLPSGGSCALNVHLNDDERQFAAELIGDLDMVVKAAADAAGVFYADTQNAFDGHRMCETKSGQVAVNGATAGNDVAPISFIPIKFIGNESYHPNLLGQQLLAQSLLGSTNNLSAPMPQPNAAITAPAVSQFRVLGGTGSVSPSLYQVMGPPIATPQNPYPINLQGGDYALQGGGSYTITLHSDAIPLGTVTADADGGLAGTVTIPSSVEPGYHELHISGKDAAGNPIDFVQLVLVGASPTDMDGDGVPDQLEPCVFVTPSGVDADRDGIDDACDPVIADAPADTTAPMTVDDAPANWSAQPVVVYLTAKDDVSGVAATYYSVNGGPPQSGTSVTIPAPSDHSNDGVQTISYYSVDNAGNSEPPHAVAVKIDTTEPTITASAAPPANGSGWNNTPVAVTFTCSDTGSGIASCPAPSVISDGSAKTVMGTATDSAGNSASATVSGVNVDQAPPTLNGTPTTPPNAQGWYSGDVMIQWSCSDTLSGIAGSCPSEDAISGEGNSLSASETVSDVAGNVTTTSSAPVRIDRTPPVTTASAPSGWSNTGVTMTLSAVDNLSGVASTSYQLDGAPAQAGTSIAINNEGIHTLTFWSIDNAANREAPQTVQVKIDKTAPTITHTLSPVPNASGWNNSPVTVSFVCGDSLSGLAACTVASLISTEGQSQPVTGTARDNAGNSATDRAYVSIDHTNPTITASPDRDANASGWFNAPVAIRFTCADALSGIAVCPSSVSLNEGANKSTTGIAFDAAGNTGGTTLDGINIDETPPTITYTGNAGTYSVNQTVAISCSASDALSGVASTSCSTISGPAWSFGLGTIAPSAATATDFAGNVGNSATSFTVTVSGTSLCALVERFMGADTNGANGLCAKVAAIASAPDTKAKNGALGAFDNQVDAKTGTSLTADHAAVLEQFAAAL
jgi:hypothetical protein